MNSVIEEQKQYVQKTPQRSYTPGEELANSITHAIGAMLAIYAIVMLAVKSKTPVQAASTAIFGAMMFLMFQASATYHAITNEKAKSIFQKIDHAAIFTLIAGTYTPMLLLTVPFPLSIALLAMIWYLAINGVVFSCVSLKNKHLTTGLCLCMGWLSIFLAYYIWVNASHWTLFYMILGGIFYSAGCFFYLSKKRYMHSIWHLFVIAGAISHYMAILQLL